MGSLDEEKMRQSGRVHADKQIKAEKRHVRRERTLFCSCTTHDTVPVALQTANKRKSQCSSERQAEP